MSEELSARLRRVEQQVRVFKELHQSELQIILDELTDIAKQIEAERAAAASTCFAMSVSSSRMICSSLWCSSLKTRTCCSTRRSRADSSSLTGCRHRGGS